LSICDIFYLANRRAKEQDLLEIYQANVQIKKKQQQQHTQPISN